MYVSIIPLKHTLSKDPYTYWVSEDWKDQLTPGCLVEIPIGNDIEQGIYIGEDSPKDFEVKPIISVLSTTPLLSEAIIEAVHALAKKYYTPIHKMLSLFLPNPLLGRLEKRSFVLNENKKNNNNDKGIHEIHHYITRAFQPNDLKRYEKSGTISIFPDDLFLLSFTRQYSFDVRFSYAIIPNDLTATKKSQSWIDVREGKTDIIAGTRRILYYNLMNYETIVYIEDFLGAETFQYPRTLRNLDIVRLIANYSNFNITIISSSPSLTLLSEFKDFTRKTMKEE